MIEQFNFDIQLIFAILNGKVSAAINRKLSRNFRLNDMEITPEQWTVLLYLWEKDGVTQQELCNATFKDKPSMTRLIDNMERQHLVIRVPDKRDRRTNKIHLTEYGKKLEEAGVTSIQSAEDFQKLPFSEKNDLRNAYPLGLMTAPEEKIVRIHSSSGTTGLPVIIPYTQKDVDDWAVMFKRCY